MIKVTVSALWALCFIIEFSKVICNPDNDCITLTDEPYQVTAKDFKISRRDVKSMFCNAFFCSPTFTPIKMLLDKYKHVKAYSTRIYSGTHTVEPSKDCSFCQDNSTSVKVENSNCEVCPFVPESSSIDIHIRIDRPTEANVNGKFCQFEQFFNITMYSLVKTKNKSLHCIDGHNVSLPVDGVECAINNESKLQETCITPSCFDGIISESIATGNILHQFPESKIREACIFNVISDFRPVEIFYSPNIKESLIVYGSTLDSPKLNLANCDDSNSKVMINPTEKSFFIVYKNEGELHEKGSLSIITVQEKLCIDLPLFENGKANVLIENNMQHLHFMCDGGYKILGNQKLSCDEAMIEDIPACVAIDKDGQSNSSSQKVLNSTLVVTETTTKSTTIIVQSHFNTSAADSVGITDYDLGSGFGFSDYEDGSFNFSSSFNESTDSSNFDLKLFNLPSFKDNMLIFILIGVGFCLIIIITIVSAIVCRNNGSCRSNSGRMFDTFQNPIYEKPIQVPITSENGEFCHEKIDLGDLSDSTVLE